MAKRVLSLILCLIMLAAAFAGCAKKDENDKGAYISMYLTDMIYDFDPARAYENESNLRVISLIYDNLFVLDDNGKVKKSLAKNYKIIENEQANEYKMHIELEDTAWTDGIAVSANDVVFAWKRVLDVEASYESASLLFDIKNARAAKEGEAGPDDIGIYALNETTVEVEFEGKVDYDQFLMNITSYALVPLREEVVTRYDDWAKKSATMVTSGPFRLGAVSYDPETARMELERNVYYYRNIEKDDLDKSVTPYKIIVDYTKTPEQIMQAYENGEIFFVGDIPVSVRASYKDQAEITDALSTHTYILNHDAVVKRVDGGEGEKIFANANVRRALSLVIDRETIANEVVFAKAATGLVPNGVFNADSKKDSFREVGGELIKISADKAAAEAELANAGIKASDYEFAISVAAYDDVHMLIAEKVKEAWSSLGFKVTVNAVDVINNDDKNPLTGETPTDIKDNIFVENYCAKNFEVIAMDYASYSASAYSTLSRLAKSFSGQGMDMKAINYQLTPHISGYDSEKYNDKMEEVYAEKDVDARAILLHEAEEIMVEEMPIIPIVFNQNATLTSKELSKVKATYYCPAIFTKAKLKNYEEYIPADQE